MLSREAAYPNPQTLDELVRTGASRTIISHAFGVKLSKLAEWINSDADLQEVVKDRPDIWTPPTPPKPVKSKAAGAKIPIDAATVRLLAAEGLIIANAAAALAVSRETLVARMGCDESIKTAWREGKLEHQNRIREDHIKAIRADTQRAKAALAEAHAEAQMLLRNKIAEAKKERQIAEIEARDTFAHLNSLPMLERGVKLCRRCNIEKPLPAFSKRASSKDGYREWCKACGAEHKQAYLRKLRGEDPSTGEPDLEAVKRLLAKKMTERARDRAKTKDLPFDIDADYVRSIMPEKCPALGWEIDYLTTKHTHSRTASLDKFRPELGYVKGNVHVISSLANTMKSNATAEQALMLANWMWEVDNIYYTS